MAWPEVWQGNVLDVGCRSKVLQSVLTNCNMHYCGLDLYAPADVMGNLERGLPFKRSFFNTVVALDVLEHTDDIYHAFAELCRVSHHYVLIALPNAYEVASRLRFLRGRPLSMKYGLPPEPPADRHRWLFSWNEAKQFTHVLGQKNGFTVLEEGCLIGTRRSMAGGRLGGPIIAERIFAMVHRSATPAPDSLIMKPRVCFLGSVHFSRPLDQTTEKKFRLLTVLGQLFVVGFHRHLWPCTFQHHVSFYLMPGIPLRLARYAEMFVLGPCLTLWLILRHNIQILVAQGPYEGFAAALAKMVANACGRKIVLVVENHGDFEESLFLQRRLFWPRIYRGLMAHAARVAFAQADLLRAISKTTQVQLERWTSGKRIVLFPTWTDIAVFSQGSADERTSPRQHILYAGVVTPLKGVHHLVNAFALLAKEYPQLQLIIIGREVNKSYRNDLQRLISASGLDTRVQFIGELPQRELATWMRKSCVFVLPSISEGLGRVVIEAMATGTPVIGSDVGGIKELVEDGGTGFRVPPGDEKALADKLRWILEHPRRGSRHGAPCPGSCERSIFR